MRRERVQAIVLGGLIAVAAAAAFAPVRGNGFVSVDDDLYVYANPFVLGGLSRAGAAWALRSTHAANWHPLTWLSHMADVSLFGLDAGAHHLVSLALHIANALLLLLALRRLTGRLPESALVAALFALHPLRVESVAWAAERKDVLGALLSLLTLLAYVRYAARPGALRYLAVPALLLLSLAAKPMAVTLPLLLLVLDGWPLGRLQRMPLRRLLLEKAPLFLLALASSWVTLAAARAGGALDLLGETPLALRLGVAIDAAAGYLALTLLPASLSVFYPFPVEPLPAWQVGASAAVPAAASLLALLQARRRPWLAAGWLWYLAAIAPVSGLVHAGTQAMADRYTYLPLIGPVLALVWTAAAPVRRRRAAPAALAGVAALLLLLAALSHRQTRLWKDGETLLRHAVAAVPENWPARFSLGVNLEAAGRVAAAAAEYREVLRIRPSYVPANTNLGRLLCLQGRVPEALPLLRTAVRAQPGNSMLHLNLGLALEWLGRQEEAAASYAEAARLDPADQVARAKAARFPTGRR